MAAPTHPPSEGSGVGRFPSNHSVFRLCPDVTGSRINGPLLVAIRVSMDALAPLQFYLASRNALKATFGKYI